MNATHLRIISCPREGGEMTGYNPDQQPKCRLTEALSEMTVARLSPALHSCYSEPAAADEESLSETCFAALLAEPTAAQIATEEVARSPIPPLDRLGAVSKVEP